MKRALFIIYILTSLIFAKDLIENVKNSTTKNILRVGEKLKNWDNCERKSWRNLPIHADNVDFINGVVEFRCYITNKVLRAARLEAKGVKTNNLISKAADKLINVSIFIQFEPMGNGASRVIYMGTEWEFKDALEKENRRKLHLLLTNNYKNRIYIAIKDNLRIDIKKKDMEHKTPYNILTAFMKTKQNEELTFKDWSAEYRSY